MQSHMHTGKHTNLDIMIVRILFIIIGAIIINISIALATSAAAAAATTVAVVVVVNGNQNGPAAGHERGSARRNFKHVDNAVTLNHSNRLNQWTRAQRQKTPSVFLQCNKKTSLGSQPFPHRLARRTRTATPNAFLPVARSAGERRTATAGPAAMAWR